MPPDHGGTGPDDADILERLFRLPELARAATRNAPTDRFVDVDCLIGTFQSGLHLAIRSGEITAAQPGPVLMKSWRFAYRATPEAWENHWQSLPRPGFHDILAMTKRGDAMIEGDLQPFLANLQFFKDLLALPRADRSKGAA
jgi:hypothetical protein